jgi:hypothetical protein
VPPPQFFFAVWTLGRERGVKQVVKDGGRQEVAYGVSVFIAYLCRLMKAGQLLP